MAFKFVILSVLAVAVSGEGGPPPPPPYGYTPAPVPYGYTPTPAPYHHEPVVVPYHEPLLPYHEPAVIYTPAPYHEPAPYAHTPAPYAHSPAPYHPIPHHPPHPPPPPHKEAHYAPPKCSHGNPNSYCLEDPEYPTYEIQHALEYHYDAVQQLYKDVLAHTENSVDGLNEIIQETYLCPSETLYIQPLRAVNTYGKWRIVVNNVKAHYETLTQTARIEHCAGDKDAPCPLVPECYETKCVQKSIYHRFLVFDLYDQYLPFSIESFQLPSSCACYNGNYIEPPH